MDKKSLFLPYLIPLALGLVLFLDSKILHWDTQNTIWGMVYYVLLCLSLAVVSIINEKRCAAKKSGLRHLFRFLTAFFAVNILIAAAVIAAVPMPLFHVHAALELDIPGVSLEEIEVGNLSGEFVDREYTGMNIDSFDISEAGKLLVFLDTDSEYVMDTHHYANVYNADGTFLYGITWKCSGHTNIWWEGEEPAIYDLRSDHIWVGDAANSTSRTYLLHDTGDLKASDAIDRYAAVNSREYGGAVYQNQYISLVRFSPDGSQHEIYRNHSAMSNVIFSVVLSILFLLTAITVLIKLKHARSEPEYEQSP